MCSSCWKASAKFAPSSAVASTTPFAAIHDSASFSKSATGFREAESGLGFFAVDAQYALKGDRWLGEIGRFLQIGPTFFVPKPVPGADGRREGQRLYLSVLIGGSGICPLGVFS